MFPGGLDVSYPDNVRQFSSTVELPSYPGEIHGSTNEAEVKGYRLRMATNGRSIQQSQGECRKEVNDRRYHSDVSDGTFIDHL